MNINFEDFEKLRIRIGLIVEAEMVERTDKLLKLKPLKKILVESVVG